MISRLRRTSSPVDAIDICIEDYGAAPNHAKLIAYSHNDDKRLSSIDLWQACVSGKCCIDMADVSARY